VAYRVPAVLVTTAFFALVPPVVRAASAGRVRPARAAAARACRLWARSLCAILGIRRDVAGPVPEAGALLVAANHVSYIDILVLGSLYPGAFLAKREIASWPVFGWVARGAGTLFVDREQARDLVRAGRAIQETLDLGIPVTIFPEGRASSGAGVLPFQSSLLEPAARSGAPCWAASLSYETPGSAAPPSRTICWHDSESLATHFPRLAGLPAIVATVRFSDAPVRGDDRKAIASALREQVAASFTPIRQA
jgi:1-acyl-sn-glycerol-3-phosphate acyltransferase